MFISVKLSDTYTTANGLNQYISYILTDTDFSIKLENEIRKDVYDNRGDASFIPSGLIAAYKGQNKEKTIPKNLAIFYLSTVNAEMPLKEHIQFINCDFDWTDKLFPNLNCQKYKNCVINQIKMFQYSKALTNAKRIA